jgi:hypothetical protein
MYQKLISEVGGNFWDFLFLPLKLVRETLGSKAWYAHEDPLS